MKVEVDADELCELRWRARDNESAVSYIRSDRERIIRDCEATYSENTSLKKELDEALSEMSKLRKIIDRYQSLAHKYFAEAYGLDSWSLG